MTHPFLRAAAEGDVASLEAQYHPVLVTTADADGKTALHVAATEGRAAVVDWLLARGWPVDQRTKKGLTPLQYAVFRGHRELVQQLMARGADLFAVDATGRSAMHLACVNGLTAEVEWLAGQGLSDATPSADGMQGIHFAALGGHVETVDWLLRHDADAHAETHSGMTCMHLACMKGHLALAQALARAGLSPTQGDHRGRTPLHLAAVGKHPDVVLWLLRVGGSPKVADVDGKTPPMLVAALLASGAGGGAGGSQADLELVRDYLAAATAPPPAPANVRVLRAADAASIAAAEAAADASAADAHASPAAYPPSLPPPGSGITSGGVFLRWDGPATATAAATAAAGSGAAATAAAAAAPPVLEYQVQFATRWSLGWSDALLALVKQREGGSDADAPLTTTVASTPKPYALVVNLTPNTTYTFRVRGRNDNGWGGYGQMAKADEATTLPPGAEASTTAAPAAAGAGSAAPAATPTVVPAPAAEAAAAATATVPAVAAASTPAPPPQPFVPEILLPEAVRAAAAAGDVRRLAALCNDIHRHDAAWRGGERSGSVAAAGGEGASDAAAAAAAAAAGEPPAGDDDADSGDGHSDEEAHWRACLRGVDAVQGRTALHHAASAGHVGAALWLVEQGASMEAHDLLGATPLLLAVVSGHLQVVKALAFHGATVNACDLKGYTAMHYAALKSHLLVLRWLCEAGADVDSRNSRGQTVRGICEGRYAAAQRAGNKEDVRVAAAMLVLLDNTQALPAAPPPPTLLDATRYTLAVALPAGKPTPGAHAPDAVEVQYAGKLSLFWSTALTDAAPALDVFAPEYLHAIATAAAAAPATASEAAASSAGGEDAAAGDASAGHAPAGAVDPVEAVLASSGPITLRPSRLITGSPAIITGLTAETRYTLQVRCRNDRGWGAWSARSAEVSTRASNDRHELETALVDAAAAACGPPEADAGQPPSRRSRVDPALSLAWSSPLTVAGAVKPAVVAAATAAAAAAAAAASPAASGGAGRPPLHPPVAHANGIVTRSGRSGSDAAAPPATQPRGPQPVAGSFLVKEGVSGATDAGTVATALATLAEAGDDEGSGSLDGSTRRRDAAAAESTGSGRVPARGPLPLAAASAAEVASAVAACVEAMAPASRSTLDAAAVAAALPTVGSVGSVGVGAAFIAHDSSVLRVCGAVVRALTALLPAPAAGSAGSLSRDAIYGAVPAAALETYQAVVLAAVARGAVPLVAALLGVPAAPGLLQASTPALWQQHAVLRAALASQSVPVMALVASLAAGTSPSATLTPVIAAWLCSTELDARGGVGLHVLAACNDWLSFTALCAAAGKNTRTAATLRDAQGWCSLQYALAGDAVAFLRAAVAAHPQLAPATPTATPTASAASASPSSMDGRVLASAFAAAPRADSVASEGELGDGASVTATTRAAPWSRHPITIALAADAACSLAYLVAERRMAAPLAPLRGGDGSTATAPAPANLLLLATVFDAVACIAWLLSQGHGSGSDGAAAVADALAIAKALNHGDAQAALCRWSTAARCFVWRPCEVRRTCETALGEGAPRHALVIALDAPSRLAAYLRRDSSGGGNGGSGGGGDGGGSEAFDAVAAAVAPVTTVDAAGVVMASSGTAGPLASAALICAGALRREEDASVSARGTAMPVATTANSGSQLALILPLAHPAAAMEGSALRSATAWRITLSPLPSDGGGRGEADGDVLPASAATMAAYLWECR